MALIRSPKPSTGPSNWPAGAATGARVRVGASDLNLDLVTHTTYDEI